MASSAALNKAALEHFIQLPVSSSMVSYLALKASQVIRCGSEPISSEKSLPPTPPSTPPLEAPESAQEPVLPSLELFIQTLVDSSHVQIPTLMSSLIYLARLQSRLPPVAKGMRCTVHRIFLASLILAAKNLNDSSPKNKHWARYSRVPGFAFGFSLTEVNLMEKQLLFLLDWDLNINNDDLYTHLEPFLAPIKAKMLARETEKRSRHRHHTSSSSSSSRTRDASISNAHRSRGRSPAAALAPGIPVSASCTSLPLCDSPVSYGAYPTPPSRAAPRHARVRSNASHSRLRSISPPSVDSLPSLERASSATPSSRASSISPPPSIARRGHTRALDSVGSVDAYPHVPAYNPAPLEPEVVLRPYPSAYSAYAGYGYGGYEPGHEFVGEQQMGYAAGLKGKMAPGYPASGAMEEKPAKKARTGGSGGFIARFLAARS